MTEPNQTALADLLRRAQFAHHEHQVNSLGGKYSKDWPQWYAIFLIENGIADFISGQPSQNKLAGVLEQSFARFETAASKGDWANFVAGELLVHADSNHIATATPRMEPPSEENEAESSGDEEVT